jgi:hypothetical protein
MADKVDNPFMVLLRDRKLPMQLLEDPEARVDKKRKRKEVRRPAMLPVDLAMLFPTSRGCAALRRCLLTWQCCL